MPSKSSLEEIIASLKLQSTASRLILITREEVKNSLLKRKQYEYNALHASISPDLLSHLRRLTIGTFEQIISNADIAINEYNPISEDSSNILFTYPTERLKAFAEVLPKIKDFAGMGTVKGISEISTILWAYCFAVEISPSDTRYIFRRLKKAKITTDDPQSIKERFFATFNLDTATLTIAAKEMIAFDEQIDCILSGDNFLIINKHPFEQLVGIEDEFIEQSTSVATTLVANGIISDTSIFSEVVLASPLLLRQVTSIAKKGYYTSLSQVNFSEMNDILQKMTGRMLSFSADGKFQINTKDEAKDLIKLLNDFWKQGLVSKKIYESNSGELVEQH